MEALPVGFMLYLHYRRPCINCKNIEKLEYEYPFIYYCKKIHNNRNEEDREFNHNFCKWEEREC